LPYLNRKQLLHAFIFSPLFKTKHWETITPTEQKCFRAHGRLPKALRYWYYDVTAMESSIRISFFHRLFRDQQVFLIAITFTSSTFTLLYPSTWKRCTQLIMDFPCFHPIQRSQLGARAEVDKPVQSWVGSSCRNEVSGRRNGIEPQVSPDSHLAPTASPTISISSRSRQQCRHVPFGHCQYESLPIAISVPRRIVLWSDLGSRSSFPSPSTSPVDYSVAK